MSPREEWRLPTRQLGRRVLVFDALDSTNNRASELAGDRANDGIAILADSQTAGRGQHGRTWTARPGSSVLLSLLIFPPPVLQRPAVLTAWAAVSVCETVHRFTGTSAQIKWPNDVLVDGKKICGILIEQGRGTVVGIGLNVQQSADEFAAAGLPFATSLCEHSAVALDTKDVARTLIANLDEVYYQCQSGHLAALEARWKHGVGLLDGEVRVECHQGALVGRLREMTFEKLSIECRDGARQQLPPEQVLHLYPAESR
jgi:BirA family biotin operon repressor/biotin-[acetyl-CoA-carboxylase] ligase